MFKHTLTSVLALVLAATLVATPAAQADPPVRGAWTGSETHYWNGHAWVRYSSVVSLSFRLGRRTVLSFKTLSAYVWPRCAGGRKVTARSPAIRDARLRGRRFRGRRTAHVGARKITASVSGRFTSPRRARGRLVVKVSGCPAYRSTWVAESGFAGGIHIPICRGQNITLADGTYYYNPCAFIA